MATKYLTLCISLAAAAVVSACGGKDSLCGPDSLSVGISFSGSPFALKVNQPATIKSTIVPESCRSAMSFSVYSGALPAGMTISNGDITGTPTTAGSTTVSVQIDAVTGYSYQGLKARSSSISINVAP